MEPFRKISLIALLGRCLRIRDVWPVGCAHCQRRVRATSCFTAPPAKTGRQALSQEFQLSLSETPVQPVSDCVRHTAETPPGPDKYETKTPLDVGGPPVINRSATPLSTPPAKKSKMRQYRSQLAHVSDWHIYYQNSRARHRDMNKLALKIWF